MIIHLTLTDKTYQRNFKGK